MGTLSLMWATLTHSPWGIAETSNGNNSRPWEINNQLESYLPDIFYSSDYQNEQVMPMTITSPGVDSLETRRKYAIDHIIYPTIGNPNLYVRNEQGYEDDLTVVLRIEEPLFNQIIKGSSLDSAGSSSPWEKSYNLPLRVLGKKIEFKLIPKSMRTKLSESGSCNNNGFDAGKYFSISPSKMIHHLHPSELGFSKDAQLGALDFDGIHSLPVGNYLGRRKTLEFKFNKADLALVCPGMYDLKIESSPYFSESQRNAVRIFSEIPNNGNYSVINITDTQVTVEYKGKRSLVVKGVDNPVVHGLHGEVSEKKFEEMTHHHLLAFVKYINEKIAENEDPAFKNAAFISFNGDLHDGGSPLTTDPAGVADTYNREATAVLSALSNLSIPIVLTAGNHDGYVTMLSQFAKQVQWKNHLESMFSEFGESYRYGMEIGAQANTIGLSMLPLGLDLLTKGDSNNFPSVSAPPGGNHVDIFDGKFVRDVSVSYEGWRGIRYSKANIPLFDGFNQWRKTYGPLYSSFRFGKNFFINLNTYDLRQHRRTGWGMYTVNYGGNISPFQMDWIARQVQKAQTKGLDIVMLAHHDPRGGHRGQDFPYNFRQINFDGVKDSFLNYIKGEVLNPQICKLPDQVKDAATHLNCMHDGLQEWMRPDIEFDCPVSEKDPETRLCREQKTKNSNFFSGYQLLKIINDNTNVRTLLFGHTHYNSVEVKFGPDEELIPSQIKIDPEQRSRLMAAERFGVLRNNIFANELKKYTLFLAGRLPGLPELYQFIKDEKTPTDNTELPTDGVGTDKYESMWSYLTGESKDIPVFDLRKLGFVDETHLKGQDRELVVLRMTSGADLADQKVESQSMIGFSVFNFNNNDQQDKKKLNEVIYYQWRKPSKYLFFKSAQFEPIGTLSLNRKADLNTKRLEELFSESENDPGLGFTPAD
jgi:hypothetical protein